MHIHMHSISHSRQVRCPVLRLTLLGLLGGSCEAMRVCDSYLWSHFPELKVGPLSIPSWEQALCPRLEGHLAVKEKKLPGSEVCLGL